MSALAATPNAILDGAMGQIHGKRQVVEGMERLIVGLETLRQGLPRNEWADVCASLCRRHPILEVVHQDPLTALTYTRAAERAPDSVFLSFAYSALEAEMSLDRATELGRSICDYTRQSQVVLSARRRREVLAYLIDQLADSGRQPDVLAFGCGDLKEADLARAVRSGGLARFLAVVESDVARQGMHARVGHLGVTTAVASVRDWIDGNGTGYDQTFDLVYSAGPFDVLNPTTASQLTLALFHCLKPHGTLVISNLARGIREVGYAEAFMDWHTVYRDPREMFALAARVPEAWIADRRAFLAQGGRVSFLIVKRT
jgi:extracellular factor (EF) 3-hydroxypalmitic acid methyl ester biosynthesis protein